MNFARLPKTTWRKFTRPKNDGAHYMYAMNSRPPHSITSSAMESMDDGYGEA